MPVKKYTSIKSWILKRLNVFPLSDGYFIHFPPERTHDLDMPEEEEESAKLQSKKGAADVTRGSNILNKVVTIIITIIIRLPPLSLMHNHYHH